jgi:hypothetical protein
VFSEEDMIRFHNGDTLDSIPVITDDEPHRPNWRSIGGAVGTAVLVGSLVGLSFAMGPHGGSRASSSVSAGASVTTVTAPSPSAQLPSPDPAPTITVTQQSTVTAAVPPVVTVEPDPAVSAETVVLQYYDAVNAGEYEAAWQLGGVNLSPSYSDFVSGYSDTAASEVTVTAVDGDTVYVNLAASRYDGSGAYYTGSYTVDTAASVITSGSLRQIA